MVASARFCSSPVSATAAQETLKRFQYESIQTLFFLSLFLCFSYPFSHHHFFHPFLSLQFRVPTSSPLILSSSLSYRFLLSFLHLQNSPLFRKFSESRVREARNREESRHLRNLFRETIIFSCRYQ